MLNQAQTAGLADRFPGIATDPQLGRELAVHALPAGLRAGQPICHQGDVCSHLALVVSGRARVFKLAESGREITLYRVEPGECCILTASCMLSQRTFPADATVESDLQAVLVPANRVVDWMATSTAWRGFLWSLLAERLGDVIGLVEEVAFRRMDERLLEYLATHLRDKGPVLTATHSMIAADLGTSREVVSRILKDLEQQGLLALSRGKVEITGSAALLSLCD